MPLALSGLMICQCIATPLSPWYPLLPDIDMSHFMIALMNYEQMSPHLLFVLGNYNDMTFSVFMQTLPHSLYCFGGNLAGNSHILLLQPWQHIPQPLDNRRKQSKPYIWATLPCTVEFKQKKA